VSGLSASIVVTSQAPFHVAVTSQPEERERTDECAVRGHSTGGELLFEVTMLLRPRAALGRRRGVRPTSHSQGTFLAHVEEGQAAPRRRPRPFSRILTAWMLWIPPAPGLEVCSFRHGERPRMAGKKVAVVLAIGHTLRAHEALGSPDALPGFLEVVHRLFEDGVFVGHDQSIRVGILRSPGCFAFSLRAGRGQAQEERGAGWLSPQGSDS